MDNFKFELKDYYDILNLHKALLEAKFHQNPDNAYVAGSPVIAGICNELVKLLAEYDAKKGTEDWTEWRKLQNQDFYKERAIAGMKRFGGWKELGLNEKKQKVLDYISPFTCTDIDIIALLCEIDDI